ncbi:MAG: hypothetical protein IT168_09235 [Bryobacterales bacterium]|nr:hypothetical protein [Bryobacterales bacterium]
MESSSPDGTARNDLNTWQEIADYLRVSVRAAQLYESRSGLPVRRLSGGKSRVWAYKAEIDEWKRAWEARGHQISEEDPETSNLPEKEEGAASPATKLSPTLLVSVVALSVVIAAIAYLYRPRQPFQFGVEERSVVARDRDNRKLWRHGFPEPLQVPAYSTREQWVERGDLDARPATLEFLFKYVPLKFHEGAHMELWAFTEDGRVKWRFVPGKVVRAGSEFSDHYKIDSFSIVPAEGAVRTPLVAVSSNHAHFFPNQTAIIDGNSGLLLREYWHSGYLGHLKVSDLNGDRVPDILVAGVNAGYGQAALVVLNPLTLEGASGQPAGSSSQIHDPRPPREEAVVRFPRTCTAKSGEPHNRVSDFVIHPSGLDVHVSETHRDDGPSLTYTLDRNLKPVRVVASDAFVSYHSQLSRDGILKHAFDPREVEALLDQVAVERKP